MNSLKNEADNLRQLVLNSNYCFVVVTMAGMRRTIITDEIGLEDYHRIVLFNAFSPRAVTEVIQVVRDILKKANIKHEYSEDEKGFHVIYVPIGQDALQ